MRRVGHEEAERILLRARPGAAGVQQVRVGVQWHTPDRREPEPGDDTPPIGDVHEYEFADGGVYRWSWTTGQAVGSGHPLWCTTPDGEGVCCVRATTVLPEPEVMRSRRGTLTLLRSRFTRPQPTVVDASVVAPADLTQGTGLTEEDALLVLLAHRAALVRHARVMVTGAFLAPLPAVQIVPPLLPSDDGDPVFAWGALAAGVVALGPGLATLAVAAGPGTRRRRRFARTYAGGVLEPAEVVDWSAYGVTVETRAGRRFRWTVMLEWGSRLPTGTRVWVTPVAAGRRVALVGLRNGDGDPMALEATSDAVEIGPPRAEIQDVVRGR